MPRHWHHVATIDLENSMSGDKKRTITLTGSAPVQINEEDWPVIARAKDWDNQYEFQANRTWRLTVRQHKKDGRTIVYGVYGSQFQHERKRAAGALVTPPSDAAICEDHWYVWDGIVQAIRRVAADCGCERIADECIADLPVQELA